ncbi:MAG: RICIN domain-containing protein, partial [Acutalibacteraceae bacterium]
MQTCLNWLGYDCGSVDGQFGSATEAQVRYFQSDLGLEVDGVVGPDTWDAFIGHVGLNDISSGFWAYIVNRPDWRHIENTGTNIQIAANGLDTTDPKQIWYFERTSDGRYRITSAYDGNRIDLYNLEANNGTNIQSWPPNETAAQEWIVYYSFDGGSYGFRSACGSVVMDCVGASTAPGTNVQAWEYNKSTAQQFNVYPLSNDGVNYSKPSAPSVPTLTVKSGNPVSFSWTSSPLKDSRFDNRVYRLRIWKGSSAGSIGTEIIKKDYTGTSSELQLEPGTYTAKVTAVNTKYLNYGTASSPVTFTVKNCSHEWNWVTDKEASCTENGVKHEECSLCGEVRSENTEIPSGHTEESIPAVSATCTETGLTEGVKCSVCGKVLVEQEIVEATGHDYAETYTVDTDATCTEDGSKSRHCTRCNDKIDITVIPATGHSYDNDCDTDCNVCGETRKTSHDYDLKLIKSATCTEDGLLRRTCTICGDSFDIITEKRGHLYSDTFTVDKAATCTEDGSESRHCKRCDDKIDITVIPATGHSYDNDCDTDCNVCGETRSTTHAYGSWKTTKAATCTTDGVRERTCSVCGEVESAVLIKLGHDYEETHTVDKAATCTEDGSKSRHCTRCDAKTDVTAIPATGHTDDEWIVDKNSDCINGGSKHQICSVCGETIKTEEIPALGHDYTSVVTAPTCTTDGYTTHTCTVCGDSCIDSIIKATGHSYDNDCDDTCNVCGATRDIEHAYGEWVISMPTCATAGVKERTCSVCGKV